MDGSQHPTKAVTCENNQWCSGIFREDFHGNVIIRAGVEEMLLPLHRLLRGWSLDIKVGYSLIC
jgi:hypothetical protein